MSIRLPPQRENKNPNQAEGARVFPKREPVITTPIKHFFKAGTPQKTPNKPVVNSPSTFSALSKQLSSPKGSPSAATATTPKGKSPKRVSIPTLDITAPRQSISDSRGERVSVMDRPRESILAELTSITNRGSILDTSRASSIYSESAYESRPSISESRQSSISARPSLIENRPSLLVLSPPPATKSPSHIPVNSKIQFYETKDAIATGASNNTIEYYEKLYNVSRQSTSTPGKREVVMKQDEWRTMLSGLIEQVQAKDEELESAQARIESLEETVDDCKRENIIIREEIREKNAEITRLGSFLAQQSSADEVEELRRVNEELMEERRIRETQLAMLRNEVTENYSRQSLGLADDDAVRNELELAFTEVDRLAKKLASKNAELKSYKNKVDSFLGLAEPRASKQGKRQSSSGWSESGAKKSRK